MSVVVRKTPGEASGPPLAAGTYATAAWWTILAFAASIPAEAALVIPGYGSLTRAIGAVMLIVVALDLTARGRLGTGGFAVWCAWGLTAWALMSVSWSLDPPLSVERAFTYAQLAVMLSILLIYVDAPGRITQLLQAYLLGVVCTSVSLLMNYSATSFVNLAITDVRISAFGWNPNEQGLTLIAGLPWALYTARTHARPAMRALALVAIALLAISAVLTASRAAFVALALTGAGMLWMLADARVSAKIFALVVLLAVAVGGYALVPQLIWDRLFTVGARLQSMDLNNRLPAWAAGIQYFEDSPVGGIGAGAFQAASARVIDIERSSHNSFLGVLVETGVVGAAMFSALIGHVLKCSMELPKALRRAMLATLIPMFVGMVVTAWDYRKVPWFFFAIAIAACRLRDLPEPDRA